MNEPSTKPICTHDNISVQAIVAPSTDDPTVLLATLRLHCSKCQKSWDVLRSPLTNTP